MSDIVQLNVGGTRYSTTRQTLEAMGDNLLSRLLTTQVGVTRDSVGAFFIDRNGRLFEHVLDFLRTGRLVTGPDRAATLEELAYFAIDGAQSEVSDDSLRELLVSNENSLLRKYEETTQMVVRTVLEELHGRVSSGQYEPRGRGPAKGPSGPVFINRRQCPARVGGSFLIVLR